MHKIEQKFGLFLVANLLLWSVVPLLRQSLPMDTQEAIVWGKYCLFGTTKHPPFSGWVAYGFWSLFGHIDGALYFLSQIFVALGVVYIYRLAREFIGKQKAVLAALLQFGIIYYNFSSVEFNVNVISLALWPMCAFYFWRGYIANKWSDWLLFGLIAGLNVLNKYVGGLLLVALGIFVLARPKLLKNPRLYISGLVCVAVVAPHIWWLWQNDFAPFEYLLGRSSGGKITSLWRHFVYPLKFVGAQILFCLAALLTFVVFRLRNQAEKFVGTTDRTLFLLLAGLLPLAIWLLISFVCGSALKSMWGFSCLFLVGPILFYFWPFKCDAIQVQRFFITMAVWTTLFAIAYGLQAMLNTSERFRSNCPQIVKKLTTIWREQTDNKPLVYVGGDVWFANMVALYADSEVRPMIWMETKSNPWFDVNDFAAKGALVVATSAGEYAKYQGLYGKDISEPQILPITYKNYFQKSKTKEMYYGFYRINQEISDEK